MIVAIDEYAPKSGWNRVSADRDLPLIQATLEAQGFEDISVLGGSGATRQGILRAFRNALLDPAAPGDHVVFHYSGHGQRIPDDNGDEPDGWDEALVPWDAPAQASVGYTGERHLRDDELNGLVESLRRRVGPRGSVTFFLDTCFSGTPRGAEERRRGGPPLGNPAGSTGGAVEETGFFESAPSRGQRHWTDRDRIRAPYAVLSAARHSEYAYEVLDAEDRRVGPLTWALTRSFTRLPASARTPAESESWHSRSWARGPTYRTLLEQVRRELRGRVPNVPQLEGDRDGKVFGGGIVSPDPFVEVERLDEDPLRVWLAAGSLAGLLPGSRIEIHRSGTGRPSAESLLVEGVVVSSQATRAEVELDGDSVPPEVLDGRAFITHHSFGRLALGVDLRVEGSLQLEESLQAELDRRIGGLSWTRASADVIVEVSPQPAGGWRARGRTLPEGVPLPEITAVDSASLAAELGRRLLDLARNRYLKTLDLQSRDLAVELEIEQVAPEGCSGEPLDPSTDLSTCTSFRPRPVAASRRWRPGELYRLRLRHQGRFPAHVNVLALQPDGVIRLFWPAPETGDSTPLRPRSVLEIPQLFQVTEPAGTELLLLIASDRWIDLRPFTSREGIGWLAPARGDAGPFTPLLDPLGPGRSEPAPSFSDLHTSVVALEVFVDEGETLGQLGGSAARRGLR